MFFVYERNFNIFLVSLGQMKNFSYLCSLIEMSLNKGEITDGTYILRRRSKLRLYRG